MELPWDPAALEAAARERLPAIAYAYYAAGAGMERSVAAKSLARRPPRSTPTASA